MSDVERRYARARVELRSAVGAAGPGLLAGYAAAYDKRSRDLGGFLEVIRPGAFTRTLDHGTDVVARFNHDDSMLLGRTSAGTLRLAPDARGLGYEVDLPNTTAGRDVAELARRGDVSHSSFAFYAVQDHWTTTETGAPLRELREVKLVDVAPVTSPAYEDTSVGLRSLALAARTSLDDLREYAERGQLAEVIRDLPHTPTVTVVSDADPGSTPSTHSVPLDVRMRQADWINRRI